MSRAALSTHTGVRFAVRDRILIFSKENVARCFKTGNGMFVANHRFPFRFRAAGFGVEGFVGVASSFAFIPSTALVDGFPLRLPVVCVGSEPLVVCGGSESSMSTALGSGRNG